ncbi:MAG TPA: type 4a pilus biogenesis protein PilO [Gammaproteobacteria bacterium]|nr:type 4a pilus biogenesis protein PilO [Gammaproteobacteria bacterium]
MNLSDFNDLDFHNIGGWPPAAKGVAIGVICLVILGAGYWFDTKGQQEALEQARFKEQELKQSFETKQAKAVNLDAYKQQLDEMNASFGLMLRQLPSKAEVADLLVDISQTGLASGLEFELFSPKEESPKDFYAELPINIRVTGNYHQFGAFVSGVAALPRIVTMHDISIHPPGAQQNQDKNDKLVMEIVTKTYRYLEEGSVPTDADKNKGANP